ncbi:MAG: hypothetical protein ACE5H9_09210 [Anaerolineae bacterium]
MLSGFDWLRRSRTGTELLATLKCLSQDPHYFDAIRDKLSTTGGDEPGPPPTALAGPCLRCWIYPRPPGDRYCPFCRHIRKKGRGLGPVSRRALVIWGFVNWLPRQLRGETWSDEVYTLGAYAPDANHFLVMIPRRQLRPWLQEIVLYHGTDLKGHIQVMPTMGSQGGMTMADVLCRAIHHETYFPMDRLRVRFYPRPYHVLRPQELDREGLLTFEISEFLSLLEMAMVFRSVLTPDEQQILFELLTMKDKSEEMFYWGRFLGVLNQEVRDMLDAWKIRRWPPKRVKFLYELKNYVGFQSSY